MGAVRNAARWYARTWVVTLALLVPVGIVVTVWPHLLWPAVIAGGVVGISLMRKR